MCALGAHQRQRRWRRENNNGKEDGGDGRGRCNCRGGDLDIKVGGISSLPSALAARHRHVEREMMTRFYSNYFPFDNDSGRRRGRGRRQQRRQKTAAAKATETTRTLSRHINIPQAYHMPHSLMFMLRCRSHATAHYTIEY